MQQLFFILKMPERISKRKLRTNSPEVEVGDPEQSSSHLDIESNISDKDFEEISKNVDNSLFRRIKDPELSQKEMFRIVLNMSNKLDNLVGICPDIRSQNENIEPSFPLEIEVDNSFENNIPLLQTANPRGCNSNGFWN